MTSKRHYFTVRYLAFLALIVTCTVSPLGVAAAIVGSCDGYFDQADSTGEVLSDGKVVRNEPLAVLRDGAELFAEPDASSPQITQLAFNERVFLIRERDGFFQVSREVLGADAAPIGWIRGVDLLCRERPIKNDSGLSRKFFIKTNASVAGEGSSLEPKQGSKSEECATFNGSCRQLSRFTLFYIYAKDEESKRVLLIGTPLSEGDTPLIGWVSEADGFLWDTRLGLRPREDLVFNSDAGRWVKGDERRACLYETIEEAANATDTAACYVPILGGNRWFNYSLRIPVFERVVREGRGFYHVALPSAGVGEGAGEEVMTSIAGLDAAIQELQTLRNLDVYFLLDGTQSMQPHINAIVGTDGQPGIVGAIAAAFTTDPRFDKVKVRYGFRVYRDTYAGNLGIGEGMPFDTNCKPSEDDLKANRQAFESQIQKIDTKTGSNSGVKDTDHEENLILGLAYAADDMVACEDNIKLMFVIGDTGYDLKTEQERGTPIKDEEEVLGYLTHGFSKDRDPIIPFFIHVPKAGDQLKLSASGRAGYDAAYAKFEDQAGLFARRLGEHMMAENKQRSDVDLAEQYFPMEGTTIAASRDALVEFILNKVSSFGDQRPLNEIIAELQGGTALVEIIEALQSGENNVPALRLAQIEKRVCDQLGKACTERVFNDVSEGFIEDNDDVRLDVWVDSNEFEEWRLRLEKLKNTNQMTPKQLYQTVIQAMVEGVGNTTGEISPAQMRMSLKDFLDLRTGLPTNTQTPLLNYSLQDFARPDDTPSDEQDAGVVQACELYRVVRWLERHREIFAAIDNSEVPLFTLAPVDPASCVMRFPTPELTVTGREKFPEDTMSFRQVHLNRSIYWIPNDYLP